MQIGNRCQAPFSKLLKLLAARNRKLVPGTNFPGTDFPPAPIFASTDVPGPT
jgi:hypothetical protein